MNRTDSKGKYLTKGISGLSLAIAMAFGMTGAAHAAQFMTHHVNAAVSQATAQQVGILPASQLMSINVVLPIRNQAGLDQFLADLANPLSLQYQQYISPEEFTARFGPMLPVLQHGGAVPEAIRLHCHRRQP